MNLENIIKLNGNLKRDIIKTLKSYLKTTFLSENEKYDSIKQNFMLILSKLNKENFAEFLSILNNKEYLNDLLYLKYAEIKDAILSVDSYFLVISYYSMIEESLCSKEGIITFFNPFFEYYLNDIKKYFISMNAFNLESDVIDHLKRNMNFYYTMNSEKVISRLINSCLKRNQKFNYKARNYKIQDIDIYFVTKVLNELLEQNNVGYCDIKIIESGSYSTVLIIGDNVLKIGEPRKTYVMYNSSYILQPFFRYQFSDCKGRNYLTVELTQKVEVSNINKEKLYNLYKALRDEGIIWGDCKSENVGIIGHGKINLPRYKGFNLELDQTINGLYYTENNNITPSEITEINNSLLLIDLDFCFCEEDPDVSLLGFSAEFENKWKGENIERRRSK